MVETYYRARWRSRGNPDEPTDWGQPWRPGWSAGPMDGTAEKARARLDTIREQLARDTFEVWKFTEERVE